MNSFGYPTVIPHIYLVITFILLLIGLALFYTQGVFDFHKLYAYIQAILTQYNT